MKDLTELFTIELSKQGITHKKEIPYHEGRVPQLIKECNRISYEFYGQYATGKHIFTELELLIKSASTVDNKQAGIDGSCLGLQTTLRNLNEKMTLVKAITTNVTNRRDSNPQTTAQMKVIEQILSLKLYKLSQKSKEILSRSTKRIREIETRIRELDRTTTVTEVDDKTTLQVSVEKQDYSTEQIEKVMKSLVEVNEMYHAMSEMVAMHQCLIERIDKDTDSALENVNKGKNELTKAYEHEINTRALLLKLFAIVFIFCLFYILFVA